MSGSGQPAVLGGGLGGGGAIAIAKLPNTGGSRQVVAYVAIASIILGLAILTSSLVRFIAKQRYTA